jgi:hypothetical protein
MQKTCISRLRIKEGRSPDALDAARGVVLGVVCGSLAWVAIAVVVGVLVGWLGAD